MLKELCTHSNPGSVEVVAGDVRVSVVYVYELMSMKGRMNSDDA